MNVLALALTLAGAGAMSQDPNPVLPEGPNGWRFERLDFPLSFAPEIELEGFEELRFAPGMFDAASESYFSYVLGIRAVGQVEMDAAYLRSFLDRYYRGLCRSVAGSRNLELDLSKVKATVERSADGFTATIEMFDAFVTGGPLTLHLELAVHAGAESTELFGAASPKPKDAKVWTELRAIRKRWEDSRPEPAFLNHLYFVPDEETFAALKASELLRKTFASNEERTTVRRDASYTGLYFYGRDTYFEFLPPGEMGLTPGSTGIAFGFERAGGTDRIREALAEHDVTTFPGAITRKMGEEDVPWFKIMGVQRASMESRLNLFSLEYEPDFLARWHHGLAPERGGIDRRAILERYAAKLDQTKLRDEGLLRDVTSIELALDAAERERLLAVFRGFGYALRENGDEWTCTGPGIEFIVRPSDQPGGMTAFTMSLGKPVEREPVDFGSVRLSFKGESARFDLAP